MRLPDWLNVVNVAAAMTIIHYTIKAARRLFARWRKAVDWFYDQYYEHVRWRLFGPPPGFDEAATLTVKVVGGTASTRPDE